MRKYSNENEFRDAVKEIYGDEYTVIKTITKYNEKAIVRHVCGNEFEVDPIHFLAKNNPTKCTCIKNKERHERNLRLFNDKFNSIPDRDDYEVVGDYIDTKTPILFKYLPMNYEFKMTPNHFLNGRRPKIVITRKQTLTTEWYINKVKSLVGDEYTVLGEYAGYNTRVSMRHNCEFCNNREFTMTPASFIGSKNRKGHRCEVCSNHKPTNESLIKKFNTEINKSRTKL